ncbi:hypothetical protein CLU79DRAFT_711771 [Phycomyces nitens]|nr:hypothetical protein CLU79DRAFT_711771 [Phycomyces nitens]
MTGKEVPNALPDNIRGEIETAVAIIQSTDPRSQASVNVPTMQQTLPTGLHPGFTPHRSLSTSMLNSMPTGQPSLQAQMTGFQSMQPTGMQGYNLDFTNGMMPQATGAYPIQQRSFSSLPGKVKIPWAVSKEEKERYTKIFKAWDKDKKGYLTGEVAKEIFTQSGLPQNVLMQIWNLSDLNNQGKLNMDEFSVGMHLIYRKINGYDVPTNLPAELIPPSTRELNDSVSELKKSILQGIAQKKGISNFSSSPSLLSPHAQSPRARSVSPGRNKERSEEPAEVGYVSSARRMGPDRGRWGQSRDKSPGPPASRSVTSSYEYRGKTTRIMDLRKQIAEEKKRIEKFENDAIHVKPKSLSELSYLDRKDIEDLKERIRELQGEIVKSGGDGADHLWDSYIEKTAELSHVADQEKALEQEIHHLLDDTLKDLVRQVKETEEDLKGKKIQLVKVNAEKSSKAGPGPLEIIGTGPGGAVTESDRIRAKAKAMVAARMGKITGKASTVDIRAETKKIEDECEEFKEYADSVSDSLYEIENSVNSIHMEISMIGLDIGKQGQDQKKIEERSRFEHGTRVADDLKAFIQQLSFESATAKAPEVDPSFETRFPDF